MLNNEQHERFLGYLRLEKEMGYGEHLPLSTTVQSQQTTWDSKKWEALKKQALSCQQCRLSTTRKSVVFGEGSLQAKLMFVGEAPGADEDQQGRPFVGKAGQLLTKIIEAIDLKREDVYICNILKCRPPNNRTPLPHEIEACEPYLWQQIHMIQPHIICCLGSPAAKTVLKTESPISRIRGQIFKHNGFQIIPTFHPAYLLRNPSMKRPVWEDMKLIRKLLTESSR